MWSATARPCSHLRPTKFPRRFRRSDSGKLRIQVDAGQEVKIGQVVALLEEDVKAPVGSGEPASPAETDSARVASKAAATQPAAVTPALVGETVQVNQQERNETLSPAARRIAEEEKVNLSDVAGTGKHGQVTKTDLVQFLESKGGPPPPAKPSRSVVADGRRFQPPSATAPASRSTRRKMTPLRKKDCRSAGLGPAERSNAHDVQRVRHVGCDAASIAVPGDLPKKARGRSSASCRSLSRPWWTRCSPFRK